MENIILQLINKYFNFFTNHDFNFANIAEKLEVNLTKFGCEYFAAILEYTDNQIMSSPERQRSWDIVRLDKRTIKTNFGDIIFYRRYYKNKHTKRYAYLLDQALEVIPRQRLDVNLQANIIEHTNDLSYEKAGTKASDFVSVSKQTVKNIIDKFAQKENEQYEELIKKKDVKVLFIEADEDHLSLQKTNKNNLINKLIYVHEGKVRENRTRKFLLNKHVFASNLKSPEDMWIEVYDYIYSTYDVTKLEKIFILGDGARWIKTGLEWIEKSAFILDSFHLNKAIRGISGGKSKEENKKRYNELKKLIYSKDKENYMKRSKEIIELELKESSRIRKNKLRGYINNQWKWIVSNLDNKEKYQLGCSAEGHVSHILASRMSSRPMSWSRKGAEGITKLRVAIENGATRKDLKEALLRVNKEKISKTYKTIKHLKRIKWCAMETLGNIPALSIGKINGLQTMMSGLK